MGSFYNRLLVVDDEAEMCSIVAEVAEDRGFDVAQATQDQEFRRMYKEFQPLFIVMDLAMPESDGVELLRFLSAEECKATIILMSGHDRRVLLSAKQLGADQGLRIAGVLQKPINISELEALLSHLPYLGEGIANTEFVDAIEKDQLRVVFQPKITLSNTSAHSVDEVEALVRWEHPEQGLLTPDKFLNIARKTNQIQVMTRIVADKAFAQVSKWSKKGLKTSVAINIAPETLTDLTLPDEISELVSAHQIRSEQVILEITESGVMADTVAAMDILTRFRLKGFSLSIDDFGTGFSSLSQMYKMPFSELKVDQSFVRDITESEEARVIVKTTIDMAHGIGLAVCAEGVEDFATLDFLRSCGCEKVQGYLISRPISGDAIFDFGSSWSP